MNRIMFELPSKENIKTCIITKEVIQNNEEPKYIYQEVKHVVKQVKKSS